MKILSASVTNFGSYSQLDLDFKQKGLVLISGPTGSGKSTLCDIIPWVLFGRTSKNGAVDEVINWNARTPTKGTVELVLSNGHGIKVTRIRGSKANDLYFCRPLGPDFSDVRGKDLTDTQKLLNQVLGINPDLYLAGAYFHEFSQTAAFFTATASNRRVITEQLVDLSLATKLNKDLTEYKKECNKECIAYGNKLSLVKNDIKHHKDSLVRLVTKSKNWDDGTALRIKELTDLAKNFEASKQIELEEALSEFHIKLSDLRYDYDSLDRQTEQDSYFAEKIEKLKKEESDLGIDTCYHCGALMHNDVRLILLKERYTLENAQKLNQQNKETLKRLSALIKRHLDSEKPMLDAILARENTYGQEILNLQKESNPHTQDLEAIRQKLAETSKSQETLEQDIDSFKSEISDVELLLDIIDDFRGEVVKNTVNSLQVSTNTLLERHFEGEIRVEFEIADADKILATIRKDGNECSYSQLSKGQRQLLRLCFGVSVMRTIANHHAVNFNTIFLDEVFDGLDEELKIKGYGLLQELSLDYENVFAIDHSESLKAMFDKRYKVNLIDGESHLGET